MSFRLEDFNMQFSKRKELVHKDQIKILQSVYGIKKIPRIKPNNKKC